MPQRIPPAVPYRPGGCRADIRTAERAGDGRGGRNAVCTEQPLASAVGRARHVDVRRVHDAGGRLRADEECVRRLSQEHWPLRHRGYRLLPDRLLDHVCRRRGRRVVRIVASRRRVDACRAGPADGRRGGAGHGRADRTRLDVALVFPDGLRGVDGVDRLRHTCRTRATRGVFPVRRRADHLHLPARRGLDLGRWVARRIGLQGLCGFDRGAFHRRLGSARGRGNRRRAPKQVPQ